MVGFSAWCNFYFDLIKFAGIVKEQRPHVKILFGGVQASNVDRETIEVFPQVDVVVRGECDHTISRIIASLGDPVAIARSAGADVPRCRQNSEDTRRSSCTGPEQLFLCRTTVCFPP